MFFLNFHEEDGLRELSQGTIDFHGHDFLEFVYIVKGSIHHIVQEDGKTISRLVQQGDCFIIDYNVLHRYLQEGPCRLINVLFLPEDIDKSLYQCRKFSEVAQNYLLHLRYNPENLYYRDESGEILQLVRKMQAEKNLNNPAKTEMLRCLLLELLILYIRKTGDATRKNVHPALAKVIATVETRFAEPLTLSVFAEELGYSMPYLSNLFKEETGMGFVPFLQKIRMDNATRLLANTKKSVAQIAEECGYSDMKFFHRIFRRNYGMSPLQYRKEAERTSI